MSTKLECSACGQLADVPCDCHAPYVLPRQRAAQAIAEHPELSDRAIAAATGLSHATVSRARGETVSSETVRTGLDGKQRKMPEVRRLKVPVTHVTPETKRVKIVVSEGEPLTRKFVFAPLPVAPAGMIGKARLDDQDMTDLVALMVKAALSVLPRDLRTDQRTEAIQRAAEMLAKKVLQ